MLVRARSRRALLVSLVGLPVIGVACASPVRMGSGQAAPFDQQFIDMMVPHHEGAVAMATIAQTRAQHQEVKAMAADILRSQAAEIDQMKRWRKAWYGSEQTPPMSRMPMIDGVSMRSTGAGNSGGSGMGGMQHGGAAGAPATMDMAADVEALRRAPEPFDLAFIDAMIPHHESAIAAARAAATSAQHPEIKQLATEIVAAQEREIGQMRQWRQAWFPR